LPTARSRKPRKRLIGFSEARPVYVPTKLHSLLKDLAKHEGKGMRVLLVEVLLRGSLPKRLITAFPEKRPEIIKLLKRLGQSVGGIVGNRRGPS
jgi:hypothetical protein